MPVLASENRTEWSTPTGLATFVQVAPPSVVLPSIMNPLTHATESDTTATSVRVAAKLCWIAQLAPPSSVRSTSPFAATAQPFSGDEKPTPRSDDRVPLGCSVQLVPALVVWRITASAIVPCPL